MPRPSRIATLVALSALAALSACSSSEQSPSPQPEAGPSDAAAHDAESGADALDAAARPLRLMTWNLETYPLSASTPSIVAGVIAERLPDIVAVQEVSNSDAFLALPALLPEGYKAVVAQPGAFITLGMLYQSQRVSLGQPELLFSDDAYAFPRPVFKVRAIAVGIGDGSFDFTLLDVHLKAQLDADSVARRKAACIKLDAWLDAALAAGPETDFAIAGDFNDELTDPESDNVFVPFLSDPASYRFLTREAAQAGEHTYLPFDSMIDHVLVTSDFLVEYAAGTTDILELEQTVPSYETAVSDHRPVLVEFSGL